MQRRIRRVLVACAAAVPAALLIPALVAAQTVSPAAAQNDHYSRARQSDMTIQEQRIRNLIETRYPGFVRAGDAEGYAGQFTDDALWMPPGETDRKGPAAIADTLGAELEVVELRPVITVREVSIVGDHAWVVGEDDITVLPRDGGEEARVVYTVLWVLRRVGDEWKITRQIWNQKPAG